MEKQFSNFGRLILPEGTKPRGLIIFYPPATGDKGHQLDEAVELTKSNFASLLYIPPYREMNQGGIGDLEGESELWSKAESEFKILLSEAKKNFGFISQDVGVVGKNLGGSVASFSTDDSIRCLIITGAVPVLSEFWVHSMHPVAVENRKGFSTLQLSEFEKMTTPFDLVNTVPQKKLRALTQFGKKDPWIESAQADLFTKKIIHTEGIKWTDDDHVMGALESVKQRRDFILECFI